MNFDLRNATIYLVLAGSRAYGTNNENSDFDYRGIAISPIETYVGILDNFEQVVDTQTKVHWKSYADLIQPESDLQVMELTKFARLACNANPSILETIFTEKGIYLEHPVMKRLLDIKEEFLTKRCKAAFCGYAREQLDKIKLHKRWIDHPVLIEPKRSDFDLPDYKELSADQFGAAFAIINSEVNEYVVDQNHLPEELKTELFPAMRRMLKKAWQGIHLDLPFPIGYGKMFNKLDDAVIDAVAVEQQFLPNFIEILRKERKYRIAKKDHESYKKWLKDRNPERAELERKYGFDLKFAYHLIRLLAMGREILTDAHVRVYRPNAEDLRSIRNGTAIEDGTWNYEKLLEFAEKENEEMEVLVKSSTLPAKPNMRKVHDVVCEMVLEFNGIKNESIVEKIVKKSLEDSNEIW